MAKCRSCGAEIFWMKTKSGKNMPVDFDDELTREKEFDADRMQSHFATCSEADKHRKSHKCT